MERQIFNELNDFVKSNQEECFWNGFVIRKVKISDTIVGIEEKIKCGKDYIYQLYRVYNVETLKNYTVDQFWVAPNFVNDLNDGIMAIYENHKRNADDIEFEESYKYSIEIEKKYIKNSFDKAYLSRDKYNRDFKDDIIRNVKKYQEYIDFLTDSEKYVKNFISQHIGTDTLQQIAKLDYEIANFFNIAVTENQDKIKKINEIYELLDNNSHFKTLTVKTKNGMEYKFQDHELIKKIKFQLKKNGFFRPNNLEPFIEIDDIEQIKHGNKTLAKFN